MTFAPGSLGWRSSRRDRLARAGCILARGRRWDANQASAVLLEDDAAQVEKLVYVLANPNGLVYKATDWPGATSVHTLATGTSVTATMPGHFFRDDKSGGSMPSSVSVAFQAPPTLAHLPRNQYAATITDLLDIATENLRKTGRAVLVKWLRIERLQMNKAFQTFSGHAFEAFRKGLEAIFPLGTWAMRFRAAIAISTA